MIEAQKKIYLCRPNGKILTQLNGVDTESVEYGVHVKDFNDISFTVQRYIVVDGKQVETNGYNDLHVGMNILLEGLDMFQIQEPTISNDGVKEYKTVKGYSLEHEFMEKSWLGLKVNTGEDGSLEYQSKSNLDDFGFSKQYVTFYKPNNSGQTEYSLIHRILEKVPGWSVDDKDIDGVLHDKKIKIDEENINLYALLTSVIAPKAECIFLFDTINKKIKAVAKESLDTTYYDTNIFVSMRNLVRTLDVQTNEDSVYTVFNVSGEDDLNIRYVNYNDRYIYDLSYFMAEPWMNQALIDKIAAWQQWREDNHDLYIQKSKQVEELNDRIYMITYQTPNDGDDWQQWDTMSLEGLNGAYRMFYAYLVAILVSADDDPSYDENEDYIIRRNGAGEIDDDYYKPRLLADSLGYYTYYEIKNYILPNIQIAVDNKGEVEDDKIDYVKEYETDWELYGLNLLDEKKKQISDQILNLADYETDWDDMTDQEKAQYNEMSYKTHHQQLMERIEWYDGLVEREDELNEEKESIQDQIDALKPELEEFRSKALITHSDWGLTEDELELFNILCKYTDYTNSNIVTTSLTTTTSKFENQEELYKDSVSKLSEVSQPQYSFNVDIDNFFDIPEFAAWKEKFHLLRFMRVGIRDDYSVKLRLIGYTTNPCEIDPMLTVEFSNFITSKSGRSDLTELLQLENGSSSPNSISIGKGNANDAEEYATNLFYMLSKSGMFKSGANNTASGTTNSTFSGVSTANLINLYTTTGYITDAVMSEAKVTDYLDAVKVNAATVQAGTVIADRILLKGNGSGILYQLNNLGGLESENMSTLDGYVLTENTVTADKIVANSITAREITTENIEGTNGWINFHDGTFLYRNPNDNTKYLSWNGSNLLIAGEIYARDGGDIGGFKISTTANTGTTAQGGHCFPQSLYLQTSNNTTVEYETGITNGDTSGYLLPTQKAFYINRINKGAAWSTATDMFYVRHDGYLYAQNANIKGVINATDGNFAGTITAKSGHIGYKDTSNPGWIIKTGAIYSGPDTVSKENVAGTYVGIDGIQNYKNANAYTRITNGSIITNSGTIGGWNITSNGISKTITYTTDGSDDQSTSGVSATRTFSLIFNSNSPRIYALDSGNNHGTLVTTGQITISSSIYSVNIKPNYIIVDRSAVASGYTYSELTPTVIYEGGTALQNKYAPISHTHPYLAARPAGIEMQPSASAGNGGFIDFHYNNSSADYTSRIIESSSGVLSVSGNLTVNDTLQSNGTLHLMSDADGTACRINFSGLGNFYLGVPGTQNQLGTSTYKWGVVWATNGVNNTSDRKLKDNISSIPFATDLIMSLNPVTFMWKNGDHRRKRMGFIAQDVASVCNNIGENLSVVTASYKGKPEGEDEYFGEDVDDELLSWSLSYDQLIAPTIQVVQDLYHQVQQLNQEIKQLKQQLQER